MSVTTAPAATPAAHAAVAGGTIVFLLSRSRHARMWRRVKRVRPGFFRHDVLAFDRDPTPAEFGPYTSLGSITHGRYFRRLVHLLQAFRLIRHRLQLADTAYCFSLDLLLIAWLARRRGPRPVRLVYEVADIRPLFTQRTALAGLVRALERWLVRQAAVVVLTSPEFYTGYFAEVQRLQGFPHVVIQHKPEVPRETRERMERRVRAPHTFRIGYFGLMKSVPSFEVLATAAARYPHLEFVFRGIFVAPLDARECLDRIAQHANLTYGGPYRSPEDLATLYGGVDLVWDAYTGTDNSRWQRTTRFSEAMYFKRPVITDAATPDGRSTRAHGVGLCLDLGDAPAAVAALGRLNDADYHRWCDAVEHLPDDLLFYGDEYRELHRHLTRA